MNDNNENKVRPPAPEGDDAEEQRECQEADETEDGVPAIDFAALVNDNEMEARSSAADGRGSNLEWPDEEIDNDAVEANTIINDYENQSHPPRGRNDIDAEEERECWNFGKSHRLRASAVPSRDTTLDLSTISDDIFTRPLPKVTFEYLRKKLIEENNEDVRRGRRNEVGADEQREHRGGDRDGDVPSIDPGAPTTYVMSNDQSPAADERGSDLECIDEESDITVESTAIFVPADRRTYEICDYDDSTRPADTKRGVPSQYWYCDVKRDFAERCEVNTSVT